MHISIDGLDEHIERVVARKFGELAWESTGRVATDPWFDSAAAAKYLGVSRQRIHDLVCAGRLPRTGEKGERLFFRRSQLDAYRNGLAS